MFPTPLATDGSHGGPNQKGSKGDLRLSSAVRLWPTPTKADGCGGPGNSGRTGGVNLRTAVSIPTPTVHGNYNRAGAGPTSGNGLATFVSLFPTPTATNTKAVHMRGADKGKARESRSYLPTPTCQDANQAGSARAKHLTLHRYVTKLYPTPAARDYRSPNAKPYAERGGGKKGEQLQNFVGGQLNPDWVEWLMGWPVGWSSLAPMLAVDWPTWEREPADVPRVATGIAARVDRLKCIGNGQVPQCAAEAWLRLFSRATGPQARRPAVSNLKA